ncbi:GNAT family N-acetyltransferase [Streptococcus suis]
MLRFPEDVQLIFKEMIRSYQLGYVDYVYQADDVSTQNRRIKNLAKNFRKMDYFYIMPLSQDLAVGIANQWHYQAPYDVYNFRADSTRYSQLISPDEREGRFFAVIRNGALMGYFSIHTVGKVLTLDLGMKPTLTDQGKGKEFYQAIEGYLHEHYALVQLELVVASFNQRAQSIFRTAGYKEKNYVRQTMNGYQYECIRMEKKLDAIR